jgi:hypothetical protein
MHRHSRTGFFALIGVWLDVASCGSASGGPGGSSQCTIEASNYDVSCSVDTDCVGTAGPYSVQFGNYCQAGCMCGGDAINKASVAQYMHDVSVTPEAASLGNCFCTGFVPSPCCVNRRCTTIACPQGVDAGETPETDATPPDVPPRYGSVMCDGSSGPLDAGADAQGPWRWCSPPASCVPFNGGWACCIVPEGGVTAGPSMCAVPFADGGQ